MYNQSWVYLVSVRDKVIKQSESSADQPSNPLQAWPSKQSAEKSATRVAAIAEEPSNDDR